MRFFSQVEMAPPDPILDLILSFHADVRKEKVDLGAGIYKTANQQGFILESVKKAEARLLQCEKSKDYLPIEGNPLYVAAVQKLVFGEERGSIFGAQTVGGTAALRVGAAFLKQVGFSTISISTPTWPNHLRVFQQAGLNVMHYPYWDAATKGFDFAGFRAKLLAMAPRSAVLLQLSCHNPTGIDPTDEQWEEIAELMQQKELFPFFDSAYQGFGRGLARDVSPLDYFMKRGMELAIAVSQAKNFGLYSERCGGLFFVCESENAAKRVGSQVRVLIRGLYSNPPSHGAGIVAAILNDAELYALWKEELAAMQNRIQQMRESLTRCLREQSGSCRFDFLSQQIGMFSYTGLQQSDVEKLIRDFGIYLPKDGRINVAGLNEQNIGYVVEALCSL